MELQEAVLRNIAVILGWQSSPRYADCRGLLTERLRDLIGPESDWTWDGPMSLLSSSDESVNVALSPTELVVLAEGAAPNLGSLPAAAASAVLEQLGIQEVFLVGSNSIWLAPASSHDELNAWLAENLGPFGRPGLYDAFGGKPSSFALQVDVGGDDLGHEIELRSTTAAEVAEGDDLLSDDEEDFPPVSLYLEVRRAKTGEMKAADAIRALDENLEKTVLATQRFDAAIREDL